LRGEVVFIGLLIVKVSCVGSFLSGSSKKRDQTINDFSWSGDQERTVDLVFVIATQKPSSGKINAIRSNYEHI